MGLFWKTLKLLLIVFSILSAHIFVVNFLPFPFNKINLIISVLVFSMTINQDKNIIWLGLIISYIAGLFSSAPFGISIIATVAALLAVNWFQLNILTNRSGYMVFLSLLLGVALYRGLFLVFLTVNNYFTHKPALLFREIITNAGWETLLSALVLFVFYSITVKLIKKLNPAYIKGI